MRAAVLDQARQPLRLADVPSPRPGPGQVRVRVRACGVCRTDLHVVDGELPDPKLPLVPGHQVVGEVVENGPGAGRFRPGDRVGGRAPAATPPARHRAAPRPPEPEAGAS
jgi:propanol-preferring alcohol dehydrogenase